MGAALSSEGRWVSKDWRCGCHGRGQAWGREAGRGTVPAKVWVGRVEQESPEGGPLGTGVGVEPRTSGRWAGVMGLGSCPGQPWT